MGRIWLGLLVIWEHGVCRRVLRVKVGGGESGRLGLLPIGNWCVVVAVASGLMPFSVVVQLVANYSNDDWLSLDFP